MAINDIRWWYAAGMLKLNYKTEMLGIRSKYHPIPKIPDLNVESTVVALIEHVCNLSYYRFFINVCLFSMQHKIQFKLLMLIFKPLQDFAPSYVMDKLSSTPNLDSNPVISYSRMSQFPTQGLNFRAIVLSLLPDPHAGIHNFWKFYCVPPW